MIKKIALTVVSLLIHLAAIGLIIYLIWPVAKWYFSQVPAKGIDLYLSASYVSHLLKDFAFRFNGWKEFWFAGVPYSVDYPSLYFYLMTPFAKLYGLIPGIQRFAIFSLFVFAVFSYLLYQELSKNRLLAVVLTLGTIYSVNLYRALVWAGGIPFWTTQALFPIIIFFIVKYCQTENRKWFYLAALASGLGIMGHPQNFINIILPSAFVILFLWRPLLKKFSPVRRFSDVFLLGFLIYLIGLPFLTSWLPLDNLGTLIAFLGVFVSMPFQHADNVGTGMGSPLEGLSETDQWTRNQFNFTFSDTNQIIWTLLAVTVILFLPSIIFRKNRFRGLFALLPFSFLPVWTIGLIFLFSRGIDVYVTGWYKAFWPVVVSVSILIAFLWGESQAVFSERDFWRSKPLKIFRWGGVIALNVSLIILGIYFIFLGQNDFPAKLEKVAEYSSAFPEILNVKTEKNEWLALKDQLTPKLMVDNPRNYRLYDIDATINIWWPTLENMPLTRGYVDPPVKRGDIFWLDAGLGPTSAGPKSSLIEDWHTPEEVADNNVRFLLDWSATRYLEGNHSNTSNSHFAPNIITDKFVETSETVEARGGIANRYSKEAIWSDELPQQLNYYRVKADLISPILMTTDATVILHLGDEDGYDILTRLLGALNLGPRKIILTKGPKFLDQISPADLKNFSAIILYKYDYQSYNKSWKMIASYIEKGGSVFIDTGPEVKESDTSLLPASFPSELPKFFPIKRTVRKSLGENWEPEVPDLKINKGIDFNKFSPLIFDKKDWSISYPIEESDLRDNTAVILKQQGRTIVAEQTYSKGKIIWSGYNLPYHAIRDYNSQELMFFNNLLGELVTLGKEQSYGETSWVSPRERTIKVSGEKGVLFKERAFEGWQASLNGKNLKIYKVGPSDPGYMYVRLPDGASGTVRFVFNGSFASKLYSGISVISILLILDYLLGGKIILAILRRLASRFHLGAGKWWSKDKDEEY